MRIRHTATLLISIAATGLMPLPAPAQQVSENSGESPAPVDLLHGAITHLNEQKTIQTDIHQSVTMFGKTLTVTGRYVKGSADLQMRLELTVQIPRSATDLTGATSLLLLVDGSRMTMRESILGASQNLTIDVKAVLDVLVEQEKQNLRTMLIDLLGIGGLPQMLRGLNDTMDPELWVRRENLEESFAGETGHDVYVLQGQWRKELLERYLPPPPESPDEAENETPAELPPYRPTHVLVYLDRQTGLPHRIEYQHHQSRKPQKVTPIMVQECRDATFGEEIPDETFLSPGQPQDLMDMTDDWVGQLRTQPQFLEQLESAAQSGKSPLTLVVPGLMQEPDSRGGPIAPR